MINLTCVSADSYLEDFDGRQPDATIEGVDSWGISQGSGANAAVQESVTPDGTGRSLKISGATPAVIAGRASDYGGLTPTWVRYLARAKSGSRQRDVPSAGIAAVTFDYSGKILASDGQSWTDTGLTYDAGQWYEVILKLDFTAHKYDLYLSAVTTPKTQFVPVKTNLDFIDPSVGKLSRLKLYGPYSAHLAGYAYLDDISVTSFYRLEFSSAPQTIVEDGISTAMTVQLQNVFSEPQTAIEDYALELKSTSATGRFSLNKSPWVDINQLVLPKSGQEATFYYKDSAAGNPAITVSEYPERGWVDALQQERIIRKVAHFEVSAHTPQVAGEDFILIVTARDENGEIDRSYSGTIELAVNYISPSSGSKRLSIESASGFSEGVMQLPLSYADAGLISIAVSDRDDLSKTGSSGSLLFLPAYFSVSAPAVQAVAEPFDLMIEPRNAQGLLTPNYIGKVDLRAVLVSPASAQGAALSVHNDRGIEFSAGRAQVSTAYNRYGSIKIRAEDSAYPDKSGESAEIKFIPKQIKVVVSQPASGRDFFYVGEAFDIELSLVDGLGNPIPNFTGALSISGGPQMNLPSEYTFSGAEQGSSVIRASGLFAGTYTVTVRDALNGLVTESAGIEVRNATLVVVDTVSPIGTTEVLIQLVDEGGRLITAESELEISIKLVEAIDNLSASSLSTVTPARFVNGQLRISVSDTEAEEVEIEPLSGLGLKAKKGKVTFGRLAKSGIGTLLWREIK